MPHRSFYAASLAWNVGHGMSWLAVPLYAASQGLSHGEVGALLALPVFAQTPLNLLGGAYTDRIGGRRVMLMSSITMALAGAWMIYAQGFLLLLAGQVALVFSRAIFWPATWAMGSQLPGAKGEQLGRLNAVTNIGQIAGSLVGGVLLAWAGFTVTFAVLALMGAAALGASHATPAAHNTVSPRTKGIIAGYLPLLTNKTVQYCMLCAYVSAVPFALSLSFYPLLMAHYGYGGEISGVLIALRSVGAIGAALIAARFVKGGTQTSWPLVCGAAIAVSTGLVPIGGQAALMGFWLLVAGFAAGAMTLYFQITISEASRSEERGSALALGGIGWNLALLTVPLATGLLADRVGLVPAFYAAGLLALVCTAAIAVFRRRLR